MLTGGEDTVVRTSSSGGSTPVQTSRRTFSDNSGPIVRSESFQDSTSFSDGNVEDFDGFDNIDSGPSDNFGNFDFEERALLPERNLGSESSLLGNEADANPFGFSAAGGFQEPFNFESIQQQETTTAPPKTLNADSFGSGPTRITGTLKQEKGVILLTAQITSGERTPKVFEWTVQQPDGSFVMFEAGEEGSSPVVSFSNIKLWFPLTFFACCAG